MCYALIILLYYWNFLAIHKQLRFRAGLAVEVEVEVGSGVGIVVGRRELVTM